MKMPMAVLSLGAFVIGAAVLSGQRIAEADSFRPPVKSIAELTSQQRLSLAISAVNQQLVYGRIHEDFLVGIREIALTKWKNIPLAASAPGRQILPEGEYTGMADGQPILQGDFANVPVRYQFREASGIAGRDRLLEVADTLVFTRVGKGPAWALSPERLGSSSPIWALAARANSMPSQTGTAAGATDYPFLNLYSDSLLLPRSIHTSADVLNSQSSNRLFDTDILSVPWGVCAVTWDNPIDGNHDFLGVTDMSWSRIVGADGGENWISMTGSPGSGSGQFSMPMGICGVGSGFHIADAMNNRVVRTNIVIQGGQAKRLEYIDYYTAGFNYPTDVDQRPAIKDQELCSFEIIADNGNGQIVQIGGVTACSAVERIGTKGSGPGQFLNPTSVCYGRNSGDHKQNREIWVADRGNHRLTSVAWVTYPSPPHWGFLSYDLPGTDLISVDVDNFGQVYVLDAESGQIYKFSSGLVPIAAYRFHSSDGTTFYPHDFAIAHGLQWNAGTGQEDPVVLGDAFVTQSYTGSTGVHRYALGVWVLNELATYVPRAIGVSPDYVRINYTLTDLAQVTISISRNDSVYYRSGPASHVSGPQPAAYWYPATGDSSGNYTVEIRAASLYSNSDTAVVTIPVSIDRSLVNHGPVVVGDPHLLCVSCSCLVKSTLIGNPVKVTAYDPDGDPLTYFWQCDPMSKLDNGLDTMSTPANMVKYYLGADEAAEGSVSKDPGLPQYCVRVTVLDNGGLPAASHETCFTKCAAGHDDGCCCCFHHADINSDCAIDVFDVVREIDVIFSGGGVPPDWDCPVLRTDFNCDRVTDVFDLIAMIDYAFSGGPPPCDPCTLQAGLAHQDNRSVRETSLKQKKSLSVP